MCKVPKVGVCLRNSEEISVAGAENAGGRAPVAEAREAVSEWVWCREKKIYTSKPVTELLLLLSAFF